MFCLPPTSRVSDIVDLIQSQWASYQLEDISKDMYCEDVDPKKSKLPFSDFLHRLVVRTFHHVYHAFFKVDAVKICYCGSHFLIALY